MTYREMQAILKQRRSTHNDVTVKLNATKAVLETEIIRLRLVQNSTITSTMATDAAPQTKATYDGHGFGIEIEFSLQSMGKWRRGRLTYSDFHVQQFLTQFKCDTGLDIVWDLDDDEVNGYTTWKLTSDRSCGFELVSPILRWNDDARQQIKSVYAYLKCKSAKFPKTTGLHVHLDAREMMTDEARLLRYTKSFIDNEARMMKTLAKSRQRNKYTLTLTETLEGVTAGAVDAKMLVQMYYDASFTGTNGAFSLRKYVYQVSQNSRYRTLNLQAMTTHGSVEIRAHHGTNSTTKVLKWIETQMKLYAQAA